MALGSNKLFEYLEGSRSVLVAGAGGGCDIYCGVPFYLSLKERGVDVHLANLTFANLIDNKRHSDALFEVNASDSFRQYAPERHLSAWLAHKGSEVPVYAFARTGVKPISEAYQQLVEMLNIDAILLVDGGTDSLMRGDEFHLATPHEDIASLIAATSTAVDKVALACTAFGVDAYHGICHAHFLENTAYFMQNGGYLGVFSLDPGDPEVQAYVEAVRFLGEMQPSDPSIVNTSLVSSIEGFYGDHHANHRTAGSKLWINPLMSLCWAFEARPVVDRIMYTARVEGTTDYMLLKSEIGKFRATLENKREFEDIPV
ncbi:MAG: DUF1152 domain-containing protein [Planctomycetota bacterium]